MDNQLLLKLKDISLFKTLRQDEPALQQIAGIMNRQRFPVDTEIITEGTPGREMYILNQGRVRIEKDTLEKERYTVATLTDQMNVFFGEVALMDNDIRSATVITETECECFVIRQEDFEALGNQQPHIGLAITREIAKIICSRLRKSNQEYINLFEALVYEIEKSDF